MSTEENLGIGAAIAAASAGLVWTLYRGCRGYINAWFGVFIERVERRKLARQQEIERMAMEVWRAEFERMTFVHRWLYLSGRNDGGMPVQGRKYSVKCIDGGSKMGMKPEDRYGFELEVDKHYQDMILKMFRDGYEINVVETMPKDCYLRGWYEAEKVVTSIVFFIKSQDDKILYFSVANYKREFTEVEKAELIRVLSKVKSYLRETP